MKIVQNVIKTNLPQPTITKRELLCWGENPTFNWFGNFSILFLLQSQLSISFEFLNPKQPLASLIPKLNCFYSTHILLLWQPQLSIALAIPNSHFLQQIPTTSSLLPLIFFWQQKIVSVKMVGYKFEVGNYTSVHLFIEFQQVLSTRKSTALTIPNNHLLWQSQKSIDLAIPQSHCFTITKTQFVLAIPTVDCYLLQN